VLYHPVVPHALTDSYVFKPAFSPKVAFSNILIFNALKPRFELPCLPYPFQHSAAPPDLFTFPISLPVLSFSGYVVHRHEANYLHVVPVDYLDYGYDDYFRFGCVEKQLAN
jgi:hypothetical protein